MFKMANLAHKNAYVPYSGFKVGVCIRSDNDKLFFGSNVENAAYPQSQCAEASAIGSMITSGERKIKEVLIIGGNEELCTPCGGCRQRLYEFSSNHTVIYLCNSNGLLKTLKLIDLLPFSFGPGNL
ncbi:MAG: Cytidine deaminase [Alphaproteobacteria bacterium MarineAlpha2_Bin1]|nr:MAG: Cytidine deaminase [Alphaproteobacteria bacterium MarineAlpha2_Bin1]